jgi:hypothetical protein
MKEKMVNTRNGMYVQVLRNLMFISAAEAASMFPNINEEMWRAFEAGEMEVPKHCLDRFNALFQWRNQQLVMTRQLLASNPDAQIHEFWHPTIHAWMAIDEREPEHFRVVQSINATLATEFPKQYFIIPFDLTSFTSWAMGRQPTEELVAEFLGHITEPKTTLH